MMETRLLRNEVLLPYSHETRVASTLRRAVFAAFRPGNPAASAGGDHTLLWKRRRRADFGVISAANLLK